MLRLLGLIGFVTNCGTSCRLTLRLSDPLVKDEKKEETGKRTNRCQYDESHGPENGTCEARRIPQRGEFDELTVPTPETNIAK